MWQSLVEYVPAVFRQLWALVIGFILAVIGAVALSLTFQVPWWAYLLMVLVCLTPAEFMAFHHVRLERDATPPTTGNTTWVVENFNVQIVLPPEAGQPPQVQP